MAFSPFRQIKIPPDAQVSPKAINQIQVNIAESINQLTGKDNLDSATLINVSLQAGLNKVPHTLGRRLQGWKVMNTHGNHILGLRDVQDTNNSQHLLLYLVSTTACIIDIEVF